MTVVMAAVVLSLASSYYWVPNPAVAKAVTHQSNIPIDEQVETLLAALTLEEKLGQMFIFGFNGPELNEHASLMLTAYHAGGVILFDRNMQNPAQVAALTSRLQQTALKAKQKLPLFVCVDQEGGTVERMSEHVAGAPSQQILSRYGSREDVVAFANMTGRELTAMGFNVNLAPVLDLSDRNPRSYGTDPQRVAELSEAAVNTYHTQGILAALKHFPGLGRANVDSHVKNQEIHSSRKALTETDINPFRQVIQTLDNGTYLIMVTHFLYPALDNKPASLSQAIMTGLLRDELHYEGLIITDDMEMGALTELYGFKEMGYLAVQGGADILLVCHDIKAQTEVLAGVAEAIQQGRISEERINQSVRRILKAKLLNIKNEPPPQSEVESVGNESHRQLLQNFKARIIAK